MRGAKPGLREGSMMTITDAMPDLVRLHTVDVRGAERRSLRRDLHDRRIGYTIVSDRAPACQPEAKVFILAFDESGRVGVLDGPNQQPGAK